MSSHSRKKKETLTKEVLDKYLQCILGFNNLEEAEGKFFTKQTLKDFNSVQKFKDQNMKEYLLRFIKVNECTILRKKGEITEQNLVDILIHMFKKISSDIKFKSSSIIKDNTTCYLFLKE